MGRRLQSLQDTGHTTPERLRPVGPGTVRAAGRPAPRRSPSSRGPGRTAVRTGPLSHRDVPAGSGCQPEKRHKRALSSSPSHPIRAVKEQRSLKEKPPFLHLSIIPNLIHFSGEHPSVVFKGRRRRGRDFSRGPFIFQNVFQYLYVLGNSSA